MAVAGNDGDVLVAVDRAALFVQWGVDVVGVFFEHQLNRKRPHCHDDAWAHGSDFTGDPLAAVFQFLWIRFDAVRGAVLRCVAQIRAFGS